MRDLVALLALVMACSACVHDADNCHNTRTCEPPSDAGATVIYVASDAGQPCDGVCVPFAGYSAGWSRPFLLRQATMNLPENPCPSNAPTQVLTAYANPDQSLGCPLCACEQSTGMCMLPATVTASASTCMGADGGVPVDLPDAWDGGCAISDPIPVMCDGGPCVRSATVGPPTVVESGCAPTPAVVPHDVTWKAFAYTCEGIANGTCADPGDVCTPKAPDGFTICVSRQGDDALVPSPPHYPTRSVFYLGSVDTRKCAPCKCGPPEGSACEDLVSFYTDNECKNLAGAVTATSSSSMCVDMPSGSSLGSKHANPPIYTPGSCEPSGGEEVGSVQIQDPFTFYCQQ